MTKYLLSRHTVEDEMREPRTEEEMHELGRRIGTIERSQAAPGAFRVACMSPTRRRSCACQTARC
jgi:hypothetical protein